MKIAFGANAGKNVRRIGKTLSISKTLSIVPDEEYLIPIGVGDIKRPGKDVTLIGWNKMLHVALEAGLD